MFRRAGLTAVMAVAATWLVADPSAAQPQPVVCTSNCAQLTVTGATGTPGGMVTIGVSYTQGPTNPQPDQGNDKTAAIAFTLGMPGVGSSTPLSLNDCTIGSDGLTPAIHVAGAISSNFKVVIENLQCTTVSGTPRNHCLCPDAGQQQDNFINVVVYGPKDLPASGPVTIPILPPSGLLMQVDLKVNSAGTTALHVFAESDNPADEPKPQFGAFLSIGDKAAIDQTFDRSASPNVGKVAITDAKVSAGSTCTGDCDSNGTVTVDELVKGVNILLDPRRLSSCYAFDADNSGTVTVDELASGVNNVLHGCP